MYQSAIINKELTIDQIKGLPIEQQIELFRQGCYIIESPISTLSSNIPAQSSIKAAHPSATQPSIKTMQTDLGTVVIFILGTMAWAYIYYKLGGWEDQAIQNLAKKVS